MRYLLLFSLCSLLSSCYIPAIELGVSQTPIQESDLPHKSYQTIGNVCQTSDGGLITVLVRSATNFTSGSYGSVNASRYETVAVKTDPQGQVEWTKLLAASANTDVSRPFVQPTDDGNFWVFRLYRRYTSTYSSYYDLVLIRITVSPMGEVLTTSVLDRLGLDPTFVAHRISAMTNGDFVISGRNNYGLGPLSLIRFDKRGQQLWTRSYTQVFTNADSYSLTPTSDGGLVVVWSGYNDAVQSKYETSILKIATDGQQSWYKKYALFGFNPVISESTDKGYILLETSSSSSSANSSTMVVYKLTEDIGIQWVKLYSLSTYGSPLGIVASGDTYAAIYSTIPVGIGLLTADLNGIEQNRETISGISLASDTKEMLRLSDGSLVCAGRSLPSTINLIKLKPDRTLQWNATIATNN